MVKIQRKNKLTAIRLFLYVIFIAYVVLLLKIVLFKYTPLGKVMDEIIAGNITGFHSLNFIPFSTVADFVKMSAEGQLIRGFSNIIGNIALFAPLGYFLPLLFEKFRRTKRVLIFALALSCFFEACQYFLYLGTADIDDVILNFIGAWIGNGFYRCVVRLTRANLSKIHGVTIAVSALCFILCAAIAVTNYGAIFGVKYTGNVADNDMSYDFNGDIMTSNSDDSDKPTVLRGKGNYSQLCENQYPPTWRLFNSEMQIKSPFYYQNRCVFKASRLSML